MRRSSGDNLPTLALPVLAGSAGEAVDASSHADAVPHVPDCSEHHRIMELGIMAAMVQKDRYVRIGRGMYKAGIAGDIAPRAVLASLVFRPMMLCNMAVMVQKDSCSGTCKGGISGATVESPQLPSIVGRRHPCHGAQADSYGPVQLTIEILQLQHTDKVIDLGFAGPAHSLGFVVEETAELPHLQLVELWTGRCMPVVCNDRCRGRCPVDIDGRRCGAAATSSSCRS